MGYYLYFEWGLGGESAFDLHRRSRMNDYYRQS